METEKDNINISTNIIADKPTINTGNVEKVIIVNGTVTQVNVEQKDKEKRHQNNTTESAEDTKEQRNRDRSVIMDRIVSNFNFKDNQLGEHIMQDDVKGLFKRCFGIGSYPNKDFKAPIEEMWKLLVDYRKGGKIIEGEGFYRITVLNILGYFRQKGVLKGYDRDIMRAVFINAEDGQAKNVSRGEYYPEKIRRQPYPLPVSFVKVMDFYIDDMMAKK